MIGESERLSAEFLAWESRGRGTRLWDYPVEPEPLFRPFPGHGVLVDRERVDDGRRPTRVSAFIRSLSERLAPSPPAEPVSEESEWNMPSPALFERDECVELRVHASASHRFDPAGFGSFLGSIGAPSQPMAFELIGTGDQIAAQFVLSTHDERIFRKQFGAFVEDAELTEAPGFLAEAWGDPGGPHVAAVEFGLGREFMVPLDAGRNDPFVGLIGALEELGRDETAMLQVLFAPVSAPWDKSIVRSVSKADGSAFFRNAPELLSGAERKTATMLFAAVVRVSAKAEVFDRTWEIVCNVGSALSAYGSERGNFLVPLVNDGYPPREHERDVLARQSHRSGMLLNLEELAGFVHAPTDQVRSSKMRGGRKTKAAPGNVRNEIGARLGVNRHFGEETAVVVTHDQRVRHMHVIGASGTGKSTLLYNLIMQDVKKGEGVSVLDPHGDLIESILGSIPDHRIDDVVLLDPSDEEHVVGFNILSAHSDWEKNLLAADLVAVFRRLSSAWGDQLNSVLSNALLAFMESDRGGTLLDVRRFLLEPSFRNEFLTTVRDTNVIYYWQKVFPHLTGNKSVGPVVTRLDTFLSPKPIRYMVGQRTNQLRFGEIMDSGKIFLAKLSQGAIGVENARLLGSIIVSKMQAEAMARQRQSEASRRYHWLYIDEFQDFLTPSLAACLTGVRKYRLGLVLAHQDMRRVEHDADVASALLGANSRIVFRVGDRDARTLEGGFSSFDACDLQNLAVGEAICRVERSDCDFNVAMDLRSSGDGGSSPRDAVRRASQEKYAARRADIERDLGETPVNASRETQPSSTAAPPPVSQPSVSAKRPVTSAPPPMPETAAASVPADLGKGGAQHKAVQDRIKEHAEKLGFRVTVEKAVLSGAGQIDLVLSRGEVVIACEVTISTTIDHEVGNVAKCIKAGFTRVALVAVDEDKLRKLRSAVTNSLGPEVADSASFYMPDAFMAALDAFPTSNEPGTVARTRGGKVVKRSFEAVSPEVAREKEAEVRRIMEEAMKRKKRQD